MSLNGRYNQRDAPGVGSDTIRNGRKEIRKLQQDTPSLTDQVIREQLWDDCLDSAIGEAEADMDRDISPIALTWEEIFEDEYRLHEAR